MVNRLTDCHRLPLPSPPSQRIRPENHRSMPWNARLSQRGWPGASKTVGPLPCLTFEVLRCTTVEEMEKLVAIALDVPSIDDIRLWVITQPLTDAPLAPRQLLRCGMVSGGGGGGGGSVRIILHCTVHGLVRHEMGWDGSTPPVLVVTHSVFWLRRKGRRVLSYRPPSPFVVHDPLQTPVMV